MGELTGKVAIVTGGAGGLGKAAVERFVAEDARVVIADIDEGRGEELAAELGDAVAFQRVDVSNADDVQAAVDLAVEQFGGLDIMFNNAGVGSKFDRLIDNDLSDFDTVIGVDLKGVMLGTQRAARHMAEQGGGAIVNTASIAATTGGAGPIVYRAAKAAVVQFSKSAAIDLAPHNIRVNCIAPGHIPTGITNYDLGSVIRTMQPLQRHGSPADVAEAVLYLVSDRSAQITGIVMPIDGGTSAGPPVTQLRDLMRGVKAGDEARAARAKAGSADSAEEEREMSADIVVRGGTVVDGTGAEPFRADVAVGHDGRITEIGTDLHGERELDADGCVVSPGFIDIHTHYDAQVFWDPALRPSSSQGVTTVVAGNCGFTIAPTRAEHHDVIVRTLENVEDMDAGSLTEGIVWDFRTYPEYLELVRSRGTVLNFTAYVGHSSVRLFVMGDDAYERAATTDEIQQMCALVIEAIDAGAAGFSTSFAYTHRGMDGKPVPSRFAEPDEVEALFLAAGQHRQGRRARHRRRAVHVRRHVRVPAAHRSPVHLSVVRAGERPPPPAARAARGGRRAWRAGVAAGDAPAAHHAVHDGQPVQPQREPAVRRADRRRARSSPRRVRRSRVAGARHRRPGRAADGATLGDVRDLGVSAAHPSSRAVGSTSSPRTRRLTARRDLRGRAGRRPAHPLPHLHRQRRRRSRA